MSERAPLVGTIILNYRSVEDTLDCVAAVLTSAELDQRIVVADNTEDPDERNRLQSMLPPRIEYLPLGGNVGYAAGNNVAIKSLLALGVRYLWVINPDARVAATTLTDMLHTLRTHRDVGILGPRLTDGDPDAPRILSDGGRVDRSRYGRTYHDNFNRPARRSSSLVEVDYVTGACMLIDARVFRTIGFIPEEYFLYYEETDFCRRAIEYGWVPSVNRGTVVSHFRRSAGWLPSPHYLYYMVRNRALFSRRLGIEDPDLVEHAYKDLHEVFIDPWRVRVETRHSSWLAAFDRLVAQAKIDGHAGVSGPVDLDRIGTGRWVEA